MPKVLHPHLVGTIAALLILAAGAVSIDVRAEEKPTPTQVQKLSAP